MPHYTVVGVWDHEGQDDTTLIVAGVIEVVDGEARVVDNQTDVGQLGVYTRYATSVDAADPIEAERFAIEEAEEPYR